MLTQREIIRIDQDKCDGCGLCAEACHEGAIEIVGGKARLVSESYCDGLGACIGECPRGAISFEQRPARPFDPEAVAKRRGAPVEAPKLACGCPGTMARQVRAPAAEAAGADCEAAPSELTHWPVQLRLVPPDAPYLQDAALLVVADCVPFALADFHARFLRGRCVVVGCPKLDDAELHVQKLADILTSSSIRSLTVIRMEVPCCGGLVRIAEAAMARAGKDVPFDVLTVSVAGEVLSESPLHSRGLAPAAPPEAPG